MSYKRQWISHEQACDRLNAEKDQMNESIDQAEGLVGNVTEYRDWLITSQSTTTVRFTSIDCGSVEILHADG